ncbi:CNP1-like family protein [Polynucleobacter sp. AP-Nino-20-G2]|uniref:CNP1-like family protein n=1 Tax=Polynucleobacter sp. AP-Nino-20-G2 TaxID=2576917 RepID=UPI001BFD8A99|nr:CNP1-like family protein [Polynucleobacter sp. AP-Nino-20-G2]QWE16844.1 CNP1-like family protein [Polynucleobacter sp. AP-Nino-20-G2]
MKTSLRHLQFCSISLALSMGLLGCAGDPLESGVDPFAPMVFKEGATAMPLNPPNQSTIQPFYVSSQTIFKFAVDTDSILIGNDGITRYTVILTSPNGNTQTQYEGIRCDSFQWRLYGTFENGAWKENPLSTWRAIQDHTPNRYQAALAQGALCNFNTQEKNLKTVIQSLNPNAFTGGTKPTNSFGVMN